MSAQFTPGPWVFARGINEYGRKGGPILGSITKGGTWHLAVIPSDLGAEGEANAHLIAAAPDLYRELAEIVDGDKRLLRDLEAALTSASLRPSDAIDRVREIVEILRNAVRTHTAPPSALAKARGEP